MPDNIPDAFKLESGLREDVVLSIHSAYFAPDAGYQDGKVLMLHLVGSDEDGEPYTQKMSVGADWQSPDGGNTIVHPTKRRQNINQNTIYGLFLNEALQIPALAQHIITESDTKYNGLGPRDARIWLNTILHLVAKDFTFNIRGTEPTTRSYLMPTEYLGMVEGDSPPSPPPPAPAAQTPLFDAQAALAQAKAAKATPAVTNGSPLYNRAFLLAQTAADFPTFVAQALADDEILADDELATQCADEGQIWTAAHPA